ncbi:MAG TPA: hypothetical protein VFR28_09825 [Allosphingosinicella sp.]|jgi:hypothetical protein|nr:hypothetical protein [Allosphingosinicella sp.]
MIPAVAAALTFALITGAGIVWGVRRDSAGRGGRKRAATGSDGADPYTMADAGSSDGSCDSGSSDGGGCGGD